MGFSLQTFAFELVNFLVLLFLLQRLLFRPLRRGIDARREAIEARERDAEERAREAEELGTKHEEQLRAVDALREEALRKATEEAAQERARLLDQAREDAAAERARAQRVLDVEREAALGWVRDMAINRSTELAGRLLAGLAPAAVERALLDLLLAEIARVAPELREAGARDALDAEVTWARVPDEAELTRLREALALACGKAAAPRLLIREDPELGAGVSLRIGFHVLDASLAGQLDALRGRARELLGEVEAHG